VLTGEAAAKLRLFGSAESLTVALDARDTYTRAHCDRAEQLAAELGRACGVGNADLDQLRICARFHDIGKIGVADAVLLKPAKLNPAEWELMKAHAVIGERIFRSMGVPGQEQASAAIRHHHESIDGSGYPDGLKGDAIPLLSRIMLIVDAYDAMATSRPYHRARAHAEVMAILVSESGKKLDPEVFRSFAALIEHSPARVS
jgi:HD-GYP domain-containing protein (c-di-GMP phosphodiesterase class II)